MSIEERLSRFSAAVDTPLIVAVACFAGVVAASSELVSALPLNCVVAFIFIQQLTAGRGITLAESLVQRTTLPVIDAHDGLLVEHGRLYVIPPNATATLMGGHICVAPATSETGSPADALFTSLAREFGDNAIGVILSGGGSDRALGIRAIRQAGGITFAQYPGSARFPNLPISAIDTGCIDFVLRPNEIAHELARIRIKSHSWRNALPHDMLCTLADGRAEQKLAADQARSDAGVANLAAANSEQQAAELQRQIHGSRVGSDTGGCTNSESGRTFS